MVDQDRLETYMNNLIASYKPLGKIMIMELPLELYEQCKALDGFIPGKNIGGRLLPPSYFAHARWFRIIFTSSCKDATLLNAYDAPLPKALHRTNLKVVWK